MVEPLEDDEPLLLLDPAELASVDFLPGFSEEYGDGMEEELEWLSNKEAFPAIESSFEVCVGSAAPPRVPARPRSTRPRRRRRVLSVFQQEVLVERRRCGHCEAEETPQWRAGPEGPKTLCNACGVRYKSGRLLPEYRPAASPTFSPTLHSNSHRRVLQMRRLVSSRHQL